MLTTSTRLKLQNICSRLAQGEFVSLQERVYLQKFAERDRSVICVIEDVADLWALERTASFGGIYHVLGGTLSALDGVGPDDLRISRLVERAKSSEAKEVILATNATVAGQTTAHYITERLAGAGVTISRLAHGVPVGGELDYLDDGTLTAAIKSRRKV